MKELGFYLQDTRRSNGVSLEEAAADLNVDVSYLENIESANVRAFKDVYYMRELVKEYAKYLVFGTTVESPLFQLFEIQNSINILNGEKIIFDQLLQKAFTGELTRGEAYGKH